MHIIKIAINGKMTMGKIGSALLLVVCTVSIAGAQGKFEQIDELLPTPNGYRSASGAPGPKYWQQRADYDIQAELNDATQKITGVETITYYNNSPEALPYLWLQLDQNNLSSNSLTEKTEPTEIIDEIPTRFFHLKQTGLDYRGGFTIHAVRAQNGAALPYTINYTMMRVDLPQPLVPGAKFAFKVEWSYVEKDLMNFGQRGGYEFFPKDGNYLYACAQWFPRMCVFDDYEGWQTKQFLGDAEFALPFGNYSVRLIVPADHIVAATGVLQNPEKTLTSKQRERWELAKQSFDKPVFIVTQEEALQNESNKKKSNKKKMWHFVAENVRDFAFVSSRKFIWEAMSVKINDKTPMAQSLYPKEAFKLWSAEATLAIKNTLEVYSSRTIDYPYPSAIAVSCAEQGMEYPMICFNGGGRVSESPAEREGLLQVIVHEIGHNFFPMIVNSDERQWSWMDEGFNSFLEKETIRLRYPDVNYSSNTPAGVVDYMRQKNPNMRPIMVSPDTQGDESFTANGYFKPAAALTVLRETVMGENLFDYAFQQYARLWAFKHPKPADFFRAMENASGVDLDWFWRGWFYGTDYVDVSLEEAAWYKIQEAVPIPKQVLPKPKKETKKTKTSASTPPQEKKLYKDFSEGPRTVVITDTKDNMYAEFLSRIDDAKTIESYKDKNFYELTFRNFGGLITPIIIEWTFTDGTGETETIPAEIWRTDNQIVKKVFFKNKSVQKITLDPMAQTADVKRSNNTFPRE